MGSRLRGTPILQKRPNIIKHYLSNARPLWAKTRCRPKAKHDPSRGKSPVRMGDYRVGGALPRNEPVPEQSTFDNGDTTSS